MDDGAERVDVAFGRMPRPFGRLPEVCPRGVVRGEVERRVAEVSEHDVRVLGVGGVVEAEEDVARLDVAVRDASPPFRIGTSRLETPVQKFQRREPLLEHVPDERLRQVRAVSLVPVDELVQVAASAVFEIVARTFYSVRLERVEPDDVVVLFWWEYVLEYRGLDGLVEDQTGVLDRLPSDQLARAAVLHQMDDAFAVDADLLEEFVLAAFSGLGTVACFICWISGRKMIHQYVSGRDHRRR